MGVKHLGSASWKALEKAWNKYLAPFCWDPAQRHPPTQGQQADVPIVPTGTTCRGWLLINLRRASFESLETWIITNNKWKAVLLQRKEKVSLDQDKTST